MDTLEELKSEVAKIGREIDSCLFELYRNIKMQHSYICEIPVHSVHFYTVYDKVIDSYQIYTEFKREAERLQSMARQPNHQYRVKATLVGLQKLYGAIELYVINLLRFRCIEDATSVWKVTGMQVDLPEAFRYTIPRNIRMEYFLRTLIAAGKMGIKGKTIYEIYEQLQSVLDKRRAGGRVCDAVFYDELATFANEIGIRMSFGNLAEEMDELGISMEHAAVAFNSMSKPKIPKPGAIAKKGGRKQKNRYRR